MQTSLQQRPAATERLDRLVELVMALPVLAVETMRPTSQRLFGLLHQRLARDGADKPAYMGVREGFAGLPAGGECHPVFYWYDSTQPGTPVRVSFDTRLLLAIALAEAGEACVDADDSSIAAAVGAYQSVSRGILGKMLARSAPPAAAGR